MLVGTNSIAFFPIYIFIIHLFLYIFTGTVYCNVSVKFLSVNPETVFTKIKLCGFIQISLVFFFLVFFFFFGGGGGKEHKSPILTFLNA